MARPRVAWLGRLPSWVWRTTLWCFDGPFIKIALAALVGLAASWGLLWAFGEACASHTTFLWIRLQDGTCEAVAKNPPWLVLSALLSGPSVLLTWYWRDTKRRDDHLLKMQKGVAERYTRAAELLTNDAPMARINGLYSLWEIARESPSHRPTVAGTLAAFVRTRAPAKRDDDQDDAEQDVGPTPAADIQTALNLASRPEWGTAPWFERYHRIQIDLRDADLTRCDLMGADLRNAWLDNSKLLRANLTGASLRHASLVGSVLSHAALDIADLSDARLSLALLVSASLTDANLTNASMLRADLRGANLSGANLSQATFDQARFDEHTRFPDDFDPRRQGMLGEDPVN